MITPNDGKYCPRCHEYINPWVIRSAIAKGSEKWDCRACGYESYIEELNDADVIE